MSKKKDLQRVIREYKDRTGEREVDMNKVAAFAETLGWPMPKPPSTLDLLARQLADAAREEIRYDKKTGQPYRANHSIAQGTGAAQLHLWIDIDEAPRGPMLKSLVTRREQMVGDGLQLTLDADHWNSINSKDEPIMLPMDLGPDIEWRKNAPDDDKKAA
jgi:hypothetical protein